MKLPYVILLFVFLFLGCGDSPNQASDPDSLTTDFILKAPNGEETTTFRVGEDIRLEYTITNETSQSQPYVISDAGPFVEFEILQPGRSFGSSLDGLAFIPVITADTLAEGSTLTATYDWYWVTAHGVLPEGSYIARATPRLHFSEIATPGPQQIQFTITAENIQTDTTDLIIITNQKPDSLQLDPFTLNDVSIDADTLTLNVSYGGGCAEHDLQLFMSPAAFMESNPVQAALYLRHNGHNDPCDALITKDVRFNLRPIAEQYRRGYGELDTIILDIFPYFEDTPSSAIQIEYRPK